MTLLDAQKLINSYEVCTFLGNKSIAAATATILVYKGETYLLSNYHVFSHRQAYDTTIFMGNNPIVPDKVLVKFTRNRKPPVVKSYPLLNNGVKLYKYNPTYRNRESFSVLDISLLKIKLPKDIKIIPLQIEIANYKWVIPPNSDIKIYGFPGKSTKFRLSSDTVIIKSDSTRSFNYEDRYVVSIPYLNTLDGASGSPCYFKINSKELFVGIFQGETSQVSPFKGLILCSRFISSILKLFDKSQ